MSAPSTRRSPVVGASLLFAALATVVTGCSARPGAADPAAGPSAAPASAVAPPTANDMPPLEPTPAREGTCPYLSTAWVETANGQHVQKVELSADSTHPACFFLRPDGQIDVTVQVFTGTPKAANALVNRAAPVDTSSPAGEPAGWTGGLESFGKAKGAVYAVRKEGTGTAVVVTTNQAQTIKAKRIAEETIANLGL